MSERINLLVDIQPQTKDSPLVVLSHAEIRSNVAYPFMEMATDQLDQALFAEGLAKMTFIAGIAMGAKNANVVALYGDPGTGKSLLLDQGPRLVDYKGNVIAKVPHQDDLSPAELTGHTGKMTKTFEINGETRTETITSEVEPIIRLGKKIIAFDEINRTSPIALNAALELLQNGFITVYDKNGKAQKLDSFDAVVMAMNDYGTRFTHSLDPAIISRVALGVSMGEKLPGQMLSAAGMAKMRGFESVDVKPVISPNNLLIIREAIKSQPFSETMQNLAINHVIKILGFLADQGLRSGDARMAAQIRRAAQAHSLLNNRGEVNEEDVRFAAIANLVAKAGPVGALVEDDKRVRVEDLATTILG